MQGHYDYGDGRVQDDPNYMIFSSRNCYYPQLNYEEAMKEIGCTHGGPNPDKETLFDGVTFDPAGDMEAYAKSFAINNLKA